MPEPDPPPRTHPVTIDIEAVSEPLNVPTRSRPDPAPLLPPHDPSWSRPGVEAETEEVAASKGKKKKQKKPSTPPTIDVRPVRAPWFGTRKRGTTRRKVARNGMGGLALAAVLIWGAVWWALDGSWSHFQAETKMAEGLRDFAKPLRDQAADLPWQRLDIQDMGRTKETRDWTLEDWTKAMVELRAEARALERLQSAAAEKGADGEAPLVPDWRELAPHAVEFQDRLAASGLTVGELNAHFGKFAGALTELEARASAASKEVADPSEEVLRAFYERYQEQIAVPETFLVRHIFLAAHAGTPPEKVESQRQAAEQLGERLRGGKDGTLAELAEEFSEDEATRHVKGLLPRFSAERMPADFMEAVMAAKPGELTGPVRTNLGFHLFIVEARLPARRIPFEEARPYLVRAFRQARLEMERERILDGAERP